MVVEYIYARTNALRISREILTSRFSSSPPRLHLLPTLCGYETPTPRLIHFLLLSCAQRGGRVRDGW